ncbi:uncharacterized protein LOC125751473 isoform X1 [Brienomyrus brachyistius]|uniref:uncharacterized protein LOC125751473 isoform X1 n=1 Tax=Brienomyrus brachyistius TaxID=42636 RepID=UPI0020B35237|nr:uncharacterized protein LOC125751473 isoform X1 [Brienomyrus brachyistius]
MSALNASVYLQRIDSFLPNGAVSVRIAPEDIPGSVSHGRTSTSSGGRQKKCRTGPPAPSSQTISGSAPIPLATSRAQQGRRRRRNTAGGRSGRRKKCKKQKGPFTKNLQNLLTFSNPFDSIQVGDKIPCVDLTQSDDEVATILCRTPSMSEPEPCSPAFSSTSFLFPSPVPSSFASSPSPSFFTDSPPPSPCVVSPVSPSPHPSSPPATVHPTPLYQVPAQAAAPSSELVTGPTPLLISPSVVFEKMERFNKMHNFYLCNYSKMTYDAKCLAHYWCNQFWNDFQHAVYICKQGKNQNSENHYSYGDNEGAQAELIFDDEALDQLSAIPGVLEMAVEMGYLV